MAATLCSLSLTAAPLLDVSCSLQRRCHAEGAGRHVSHYNGLHSRVMGGAGSFASVNVRKCSTVVRRSKIVAAVTTDAEAGEKEAGAVRPKKRPGEAKGFVEEMRFRAMKLHTREQAPKEGEKAAVVEEEKPLAKWAPTRAGLIQFLVDSKAVHDVLEEVVNEGGDGGGIYSRFQKTGLERGAALALDLAHFESEGEVIPAPGPAGLEYASYLRQLAASNPPAFICHFYNVYFAHSAGGRMIGRKVSEMLLNNLELSFYKWEGDLQELLQAVRDQLNGVAETWSREEKDVCLAETELSFKYSGKVLRVLVMGA